MNNVRVLSLTMMVLFATSVHAQQSESMTKRYYNNPEIKFNTPVNLQNEGRFATYDEIMGWISKNCTGPLCRVEYVGKSGKGLEVPIVYISNNLDKALNRSSKKLRVWMQGALHGNEPAGAEGLFAIIDYLLHGDGVELLDKLDVAILPVANIDGYLAQDRRAASGLDLNRDQSKFGDEVSKMIKQAFTNWHADAAFDFHEFRPIRNELDFIGEKGGALYYDALFLPTGHPNVADPIRNINVSMFEANAEKALDEIGYTHNFYFTVNKANGKVNLVKAAKSPQSSSTSYALNDAVSLLVEIRGIGLGRTSFVRRTNTAFTIAKSFLETAAENDKVILKTLKHVRNNVPEKIFVTGHSSEYKETVSFLDMKSEEVVSRELNIVDALSTVTTLERSTPKAYLLDKSMTKEVERLRLLGVNVETLKKAKSYEVESYKVVSVKEKAAWEKIKPVDVKTQIIKEVKTFPAGTYVVKMKGRGCRHAATMLEPESANGFVSFCVTDVREGDMLDIYRVIK